MQKVGFYSVSTIFDACCSLSAGPESVDGILIKSVIIQMKAIDQFFPVVLSAMLYNAVQTFESVDGGCIGNLNPLTPENFYVFE